MTDYLAAINPHKRDAEIEFDEKPHIYTVRGSTDNTSVTKFCHSQFKPFNAHETIQRMMASPNWPKNKYFGKTEKEIALEWKKQGCEAAVKGTKMHKMIEDYYQLGQFKEPIECSESEVTLFKEFLKKNSHLKPYRAEWMIWDEELRLAGSIDMVFKNHDGDLVIYDWKRCKNIKKTAYGNAFSRTSCISHIPDSNYWHYALQLNVYKAILEKNYDVEIKGMALVQLHPEQTVYKIFHLPDLQSEVKDLFALRLSKLH